MALTKYEQETTVTMNREDDYVSLYTANARHIRAIFADDRFFDVDRFTGEDGELETVRAKILVDHFDPITGLKRRQRVMSDEEKAVVAERLSAARQLKRVAKGLGV